MDYGPGFSSGGDGNNSNNYSRNRGGYNKPSGNQWKKKKYTPKPFVAEEYLPYGIVLGRNIPGDITERLEAMVKWLNDKGFSLRYSVSDEAVCKEVYDLKLSKAETILPFPDFDQKKGSYNCSKNAKELMNRYTYFDLTEKKKGFQWILSTQVHTLLGQFLNSRAAMLITWTEDGITHVKDKTPNTGFNLIPIKIANIYNIPVFNLNDPDSFSDIQKFVNSSFLSPEDKPDNQS